MSSKPMEGLKVADFSGVIAGPLTAKYLADSGALVVKIEGKTRVDPERPNRPYKDGIPGINRSGHFNEWNTSKLSVAVNLAKPKGVELAKRFVAWADVVVENFAGGVMERMGLGYEELKKVNPDIIMLSNCLQGQTGPYAKQPGFGSHMVALTGINDITGWPDRQPGWIQSYTDFIAPHFNFILILSALLHRQRTGKGVHFDVSQFEGAMHFLAPCVLEQSANQRDIGRMGNRDDRAAPHAAYRCRGEDRWCAVAVFTEEAWEKFCGVIGSPAWCGEARFNTLSQRKANEDELDKLVEAWTANHSAEEVMSLMQAAGVAAGVLETVEDLLEHDPQLAHRRTFWEVEHGEIGKYYARRPPYLLSKATYEIRGAPLLGEHNEYALKQVLGMSDTEYRGLVAEGVVE